MTRSRTTRFRAALAVPLLLAVPLVAAGCATTDPVQAEPTAETGPGFVIDQDFPDPDLLEVDGEYLAFATNSPGANVQWASSTDLDNWKVSTDDALPTLPDWASAGRTWAPDVSVAPGGGYVMYFVAEHTSSGKQCIGAATAAVASGPFTPVAGKPIVCTLDEGGAIDPSTFTDDDGSRFLVWKNDGNCCDLDTWIQLAPLAEDGASLTGPAVKLFKQTESWEGNLVEAPTLVKHGATYWMFYSANDYSGDAYAIGAASARSLEGPYTKNPEPFLTSASSGDRYYGPGGQDVISTPDGDVMFFHSWDENVIYRGMSSRPLAWDGDVPALSLEK